MTKMIRKIKIEDYNYPLPEEKIALYPLPERDMSKLLVADNGHITESVFRKISDFLPPNTLLIFNDTKVVKARMVFYKTTNAKIELFCLEPYGKGDITLEMAAKNNVRWKCLVGNSRRWKDEQLTTEVNINGLSISIKAKRVEILSDCSVIDFSWNGNVSFAEILDAVGKVPLPPYIHRESDKSDAIRYQTVYAKYQGSVAAPTAGLHFTEPLMRSLEKSGMEFLPLTLHVGAGTFKPVSSEFITDHAMHEERIVVSQQFIDRLSDCYGEKYIVPVGTTSCRSLESLYWLGLKLMENTDMNDQIPHLEQWYPYLDTTKTNLPVKDALASISNYMKKRNSNSFEAATSLMITPDYKMKFPDALITNFHQPKSTLLLLISSILGDTWKDVYRYALEHDFRLLSYGDSCLLKID